MNAANTRNNNALLRIPERLASTLTPVSNQRKSAGTCHWEAGNTLICNNQWERCQWLAVECDGTNKHADPLSSPNSPKLYAKTAHHQSKFSASNTISKTRGRKRVSVLENPNLVLGVKYKPFMYVLFWLHLKNINLSKLGEKISQHLVKGELRLSNNLSIN